MPAASGVCATYGANSVGVQTGGVDLTKDEIAALMNDTAGQHWGDEAHFQRFAYMLLAAERQEWPNLDPVITWLEKGCDPKEAAKELRIYAAVIHARRNK